MCLRRAVMMATATVAMAVAGAGCATVIDAPEPPATLESVSGTWIGVGGWRTYRLALVADGPATLAVLYSYDADETRLYRASRWSLSHGRVEATFDPVDDTHPRVAMSGRAHVKQLNVGFRPANPPNWVAEDAVLVRETLVDERLVTLRAAMNELDASE